MTPPTDTRTLRDRDVEIAKRLGWRVVRIGDFYELLEPDKEVDDHAWLDCCESESEAWSGAPKYSTNLGDAAGLLVHVLTLSWRVDSIRNFNGRLTTIALAKEPVAETVRLMGQSSLPDPQAAFCAAVSEACLKALESEVGDAVD